jgi:hypothetical protein
MNATAHPIDRPAVSPTRLWFGLAAGAVAFSIDGLANWVISWRTCFIGNGHLGDLSSGGIRTLLAAITLSLLALSLAGGVVSYRNWKTLAAPDDLEHAEAHTPASFLALLGICVSAVLSVGICWIGVPLFLVDLCMRAR